MIHRVAAHPFMELFMIKSKKVQIKLRQFIMYLKGNFELTQEISRFSLMPNLELLSNLVRKNSFFLQEVANNDTEY